MVTILVLPFNTRHLKSRYWSSKSQHSITSCPAPLTLTQNTEAVRPGNYRDCFVNQAHPWLLLVNSHTHHWNSWKRTLLVWLCWTAYCNYVAFNCALLTPSDWDALWPGTQMSLLYVDLRLIGIVCFVIEAHFPSFHCVVITVELQRKGEQKEKYLSPAGGLESITLWLVLCVMSTCNWLTSCMYLSERKCEQFGYWVCIKSSIKCFF